MGLFRTSAISGALCRLVILIRISLQICLIFFQLRDFKRKVEGLVHISQVCHSSACPFYALVLQFTPGQQHSSNRHEISCTTRTRGRLPDHFPALSSFLSLDAGVGQSHHYGGDQNISQHERCRPINGYVLLVFYGERIAVQSFRFV